MNWGLKTPSVRKSYINTVCFSSILAKGIFFSLFASAQAATIPGTSGPDILVGPTSNDVFLGFEGNDALYGDFFNDTPGFPDLEVPCTAGAATGNNGGNGGEIAGLANDSFSDGEGDDTVIGDAFARNFGEFQLNALAGTGAYLGGGGGGGGNAAKCFSDAGELKNGEFPFAGGNGADLFVGDASSENTHSENTEIDAGAGSAAMGKFAFYPFTNGGGAGGNSNTLEAFNDIASFASALGRKRLIGDVYTKAPAGGQDRLIASAGSGAAPFDGSNANGGHLNRISVFNDRLLGGVSGPVGNEIVGDDFIDGGSGDTLLVASAGAGGEAPGGGIGGSYNTLGAFWDQLGGNGGRDLLVGDALLGGGPTNEIKFVIHSGFSQPGGGAGGFGNTVVAFNDVLNGGFGADVIIGDAWNRGSVDSIKIVVGGDSGNQLTGFQDIIDGGPAADLIYGDFRYDSDVCELDQFDLTGGFSGRDRLFADQIKGGTGPDRIHGGFGPDQMTGGANSDTYLYYGPDLAELGAGVPLDQITDFTWSGPLPGRDKLDLRPLLRCLGFDPGDVVADWLRISGGGLATFFEIDRDGPAGGFVFAPMISVPGLSGATATGLVASGQLLVP